MLKKKPKRRKLDQFLHERRKDPEVALSEMTRLSNRIWRIAVGVLMTSICIGLLYPGSEWKRVLGLGGLLFVVNGLGWVALLRIQPGLFDRPAAFNRFIVLILATVLVSKAFFLLDWSPFLAPLPVLAMIMSMAYGPSVSLLVVIGLGFYLSLLSPRVGEVDLDALRNALESLMLAEGSNGNTSITLLMYHALSRADIILGLSLVLGGVVSVLGVQRIRQQSRPALVGGVAGLAQASVVFAFRVLDPDFSVESLSTWDQLRVFMVNPGWAFVGALASGGVVTVFLPLIERLFSIVSERRLLALSDPNNDLLRTLRNRAPGTYQHTLGVAQLSSAAAEAIGADALLCQTGAYYHDIGKIVKPEYFVENMGEDKTIHSRLRPSMSKLIIISHVKEGIELAQEAKLPQKIIDMIPMHHGTTVVEYFFHKAVEMSNGESRHDDSEYRYPGPRPRFREAGILMLADAVEAIAKSMVEPTTTRFQGMVSDVVRKRLHDGQLDLCNLTIADLRQIQDSFVRTLTNMYHGRIRYPSAAEGAEADSSTESRADGGEKGAEKDAAKSAERTSEKTPPRGEPIRQGADLQRSGKP